MVKMIMHGCCGAMGHVITGLAAEDEDIGLWQVLMYGRERI